MAVAPRGWPRYLSPMPQEDPYRGQAARCPGCGELMTSRTVADSTIDCCARCGGVWLDWFDGSPPDIARSLNTLGPDAALPASDSVMECPRCRAPLESEAFHGGPTVCRCGACYGLFVAREGIAELARAEQDSAPEARGPLQELMRRIRAIFGDA